MNDPDFLARPDGLKLAYRHRKGWGPTIVFLPGYMSDMEGGKATALDAWAEEIGRAMLRLDYAGCGASEGRFADGTLASWRDDVLHLIDHLTDGPLLLVGSSMGGWLMLLVALARPDRVKGLVGIAAAPDFTEWGFDAEDREKLARDGRIEEISEYSDEPYVTTRAFWESGQANRLLTGEEIGFDGPVRLLHGQQDDDVPWPIAVKLAAALRSADVHTLLIKDGDHRLSRGEDIARLIWTVDEILERL
ncbi:MULTISPECIES: alpha/beta fold hydrolase [Sphingomonadales]|uniref:Palmitoyl-protein thioesterase ABHD10, mitochondrial n=2 Tax=Edaphosphingomonas TaxID=3423724 RepID=A0A2T4I8G0_9SPHN|nr:MULTISPECIES: alpha/beta hydrolase [Sphingomonas]AGH49843.1 alpha/beta hydrolase fold protein [Sphingomonas sp. MM-1]MDX3883896.1 alpha/beta hydrolase [Sphingomonas sp.]OHT18158.1 Alpha/beta hydrolase family protein [Sphingomonas haloaromaticamans]PTD28039.1 alpha/beta hydrolase [Sphingomonas fennica]